MSPRLGTDDQVLEAYAKGLGQKKWAPIEQKLKDGESASPVLPAILLTTSVRLRGRKRDMTG